MLNEGIPLGGNLMNALPWLDQLLIISVSSARFGFVFLFVPLFSSQAMPATVRNSIIIAFGLVAYVLQTQFLPRDLSAAAWALMLMKECAAGIIIGLFFGTIFWAMGAAGELIDTKVGATTGQLTDPLSGLQTSLTAILLIRFAQIAFVSAGGLTILIGTVMESYAIWPMGPGPIILNPASIRYFEGEFGRLFVLVFVFAAPVLMVLYVIDVGMGLLNRFAQQFNVFSLSMPIKAAAAIVMLIATLPLLGQAVIGDMQSRNAIASAVLGRTGQPAPAPRPGTRQVPRQTPPQILPQNPPN